MGDFLKSNKREGWNKRGWVENFSNSNSYRWASKAASTVAMLDRIAGLRIIRGWSGVECPWWNFVKELLSVVDVYRKNSIKPPLY